MGKPDISIPEPVLPRNLLYQRSTSARGLSVSLILTVVIVLRDASAGTKIKQW